MLTLRLPKALEAEFLDYCQRHGVTKTEAGLTALRKLLIAEKLPLPVAEADPLAAFRGVAKGGMSTDELMRMTRGEDWNQP